MTTTPAVAPLSADEMDETLARVERAATMFRGINAFHPGHFRQLQNFANDALALIAQARAAQQAGAPAPSDQGALLKEVADVLSEQNWRGDLVEQLRAAMSSSQKEVDRG